VALLEIRGATFRSTGIPLTMVRVWLAVVACGWNRSYLRGDVQVRNFIYREVTLSTVPELDPSEPGVLEAVTRYLRGVVRTVFRVLVTAPATDGAARTRCCCQVKEILEDVAREAAAVPDTPELLSLRLPLVRLKVHRERSERWVCVVVPSFTRRCAWSRWTTRASRPSTIRNLDASTCRAVPCHAVPCHIALPLVLCVTALGCWMRCSFDGKVANPTEILLLHHKARRDAVKTLKASGRRAAHDDCSGEPDEEVVRPTSCPLTAPLSSPLCSCARGVHRCVSRTWCCTT
jgi:hypothetical protein